MSQSYENQEVPLWLQRASRAVVCFMERNSIRTFSHLQTETGLNYRTLRKLAPGHINPSITFEAVVHIFAQLGYYIKECDGTAMDEADDYEGLDTELMSITMLYFGKKKVA